MINLLLTLNPNNEDTIMGHEVRSNNELLEAVEMVDRTVMELAGMQEEARIAKEELTRIVINNGMLDCITINMARVRRKVR